jgi:aryl-alcohol dehydrogenase-like predicted oxidoreductase
MHRDFEREILPMAKDFGLALAPWDVLGGGRLQSKKQVSLTLSHLRPYTSFLALI